MSNTPEEFRLGDAAVAQYRRSALTRALPITVLVAVVGLALGTPRGLPTGFMVGMAGFLILFMGFTMWRTYQRELGRLREYRLAIGSDELRRQQPGLPELRLRREEVTKLVISTGHGLSLFATGRQPILVIPETLEGFSRARGLLEPWGTPEVAPRPAWATWAPLVAGIATVAGFFFVVKSTNAILVTVVGVSLVAALVASLILIQRSPHVEARIKRSAIFLALPILAILSRVLSVWHLGPGD